MVGWWRRWRAKRAPFPTHPSVKKTLPVSASPSGRAMRIPGLSPEKTIPVLFK